MTEFKGEISDLKKALKQPKTTVDWIEAFIDNENHNTEYTKIISTFHKAGYKSLDEMDDTSRKNLIVSKDFSEEKMAAFIIAIAMDYDLAGNPDTVYGTNQNVVKRFLEKYKAFTQPEAQIEEIQKGHGANTPGIHYSKVRA